METQDVREEQTNIEGVRPTSKSDLNVLKILFVLLGAITCCCVVVFALLAWQDPFDWNLLARLAGDYDAAAEAAPEDTMVYIGVDLLQLTTNEIQQVFEAIAANNPDSTISTPEDALNEMDDEFGFNIVTDILPWVGQYAGASITNVELDSFGEIQTFDLVFAASVRNLRAAEAFAVKFQQQLESDSGSPMLTSDYEGTTIYELTGPDATAFTLYKNLLLIGNSRNAVRAAIDAKNTKSFMDSQVFKNLSDQLPAGRVLTGFLTKAMFQDLLNGLQQSAGGVSGFNNVVQYQSMALGLSFTKEGIQLDSAAQFDPGTVEGFQEELVEAYSAEIQLDQRFPANTLVYFRGNRPDLSWRLFRNQMEAANMAVDLDEAMDSFDDEFGFSPADDLFQNLDGEYMLTVLPSTEGMLAADEINLGLALLFETSQPAALAPVMDGLDTIVASELGFPPASVDVGGFAIRELNVPFLGELLSYGVVDDLMLIATSTSLVNDIFADGPSLAADSDYQEVWTSFHPDMKPVFFANLSGLIGSVKEGMGPQEQEIFDLDFGNSVSWIKNIAMANRYDDSGTQMSRLIVFVNGMED